MERTTLSSIYKRKDGRYEGRCHIFENGEKKLRYFYGYSEKEVKSKISEFMDKQSLTDSVIKFRKLYSEWFRSVSITIKESTACNYQMKAEKHLIPFFGDFPCAEIDHDRVIDFIEQKRKENLSDRYIADIIVLIKSVFKYGSRKYHHRNPIDGLKISVPRNREVKLLDSDQYIHLQKTIAAEETGTSAAIALAMATGLRIGELCALQWKDIDLAKRVITVSKTIQRIKSRDTVSKTRLVITTPKTDSSIRVIPLPDCVVSVIEKFKSSDNSYLLSGTCSPVEPRTLQYRFRRILDNAELPSVHFHSLRHMFATACIQHGMDVKTLSEILGHSSIETTLNRYVHSSFEQKIKAINLLEFSF